MGWDQLDEHVPGVGHGQGDVGLRGLPAVRGALAGEVGQQEPRPDLQLFAPPAHARVDVLDDVGHLEDAGLGLAESEEAHGGHARPRAAHARGSGQLQRPVAEEQAAALAQRGAGSAPSPAT